MSSEFTNLREISESQILWLKKSRWRARHDLLFLCNEILDYKDVSKDLHGPVIANLQQFPVPNEEQFWANDQLVRGRWEYKPLVDMADLPGKRRMLLLDSRGFLKTTVNCIAHSIQWILNYPDMAIMIVQSNSEKAEDILAKIKAHFQSNPKFRALFPEMCPQKKVNEWGRRDRVAVEDKRYDRPRGGVKSGTDYSFITASIMRGMAGTHVELIKFSDIVEPDNISGEGIEVVKRNYGLMHNLLIGPTYWIDVEGTRYHMNDLYGKILDDQMRLDEELRDYNLFVRGATVRDWGGKPEEFTMESILTKKEVIDADGFPQSRWPERFPSKVLATMAKRNPWEYYSQQQQSPAAIGGLTIFPVNDQYPKWISARDFVQNVRINCVDITVDTAETVSKRSDYTAIVVAGWSNDGKCYVMEIAHGRYLPSDIVEKIIQMAHKYRTRLGKIKIEETGFVRGLMPALRRRMDLQGLILPIDTIKRDNDTAKVERISNTLQPYYHSGELIFVDGFMKGNSKEAKEEAEQIKVELLDEFKYFPAAAHDDILDAVSDIFQNKTWFGRLVARGYAPRQNDLATKAALGILSPEEEDEFGYVVPTPAGPPRSTCIY